MRTWWLVWALAGCATGGARAPVTEAPSPTAVEREPTGAAPEAAPPAVVEVSAPARVCPPIEIDAAAPAAPSAARLEALREAIEVVAGGGEPARFEAPSGELVAGIRAEEACATHYDGELLRFDRVALGTLPVTLGWGRDGELRIETDAADEVLAQRRRLAALRAWLDASPGADVGTTSASYLTARWVERAESADLCVSAVDPATPLAGAPAGLCVSMSPAPRSVSLLARVEPPYEDDEAEGTVHEARALLRLGGATFVIRDGAVVPERVRLGRDEAWPVPIADRAPRSFTFTSLAGWTGPDDDTMELAPRRFDDDTRVGDGLFCRRDGLRWVCADPADVRRLGTVARIEVDASGALWVVGVRSDGGSELVETRDALHLLDRDGDSWVLAGSVAVRRAYDEHVRELLYEGDEEVQVSEGTLLEASWVWSIGGARCLTLERATAGLTEYTSVFDGTLRPERRRSTHPSVRYGEPVARLPRFAESLDGAGFRFGDPLAADGSEPPVDEGGALAEDRRGHFVFDESGWARVERCPD